MDPLDQMGPLCPTVRDYLKDPPVLVVLMAHREIPKDPLVLTLHGDLKDQRDLMVPVNLMVQAILEALDEDKQVPTKYHSRLASDRATHSARVSPELGLISFVEPTFGTLTSQEHQRNTGD